MSQFTIDSVYGTVCSKSCNMCPFLSLIACLLGCPACLPVCLSADIPQASKSDNMCSIKATRAGAHPVHLRQGLIWVWPEGGTEAAAEAAATPAVVAPQLDDPR
jgi:hypothetical protein